MTDLAVIKATFCDFRIVKGRKQAQLVFELPLEMAQDAITKLGMPKPSDPAWCAIALLNVEAAAQPSTDKSAAARERYRQMPEWQQALTRAVLLCKDEQFQNWLARKQRRGLNWGDLDREQVTGDWLKRELGAESRKEIAVDPVIYRAFIALETAYKQATGQMAEPR